jgi:hypothetical protein
VTRIKVHRFKPRQLVALLLGCAALRCDDLLLLDDAANVLANKMRNCAAHEVAAALAACAALRYHHPRLLATAGEALQRFSRPRSPHQLTLHQVCEAAAAFAALGCWQAQTLDALAGLAAARLAGGASAEPALLGRLAGSYAALRHVHPGLLAALEEVAVAPSAAGWQVGQLAALVHDLTSLGRRPELLLARAVQAAGVGDGPAQGQAALWVRLAWDAAVLNHDSLGTLVARVSAELAAESQARGVSRRQAAEQLAAACPELAQLAQDEAWRLGSGGSGSQQLGRDAGGGQLAAALPRLRGRTPGAVPAASGERRRSLEQLASAVQQAGLQPAPARAAPGPQMEYRVPGTTLVVDVALLGAGPAAPTAVQLLAEAQLLRPGGQPGPAAALTTRLLQHAGWTVLHVPEPEWRALKSSPAKQEAYVRALLLAQEPVAGAAPA